jgi:HNH endonuclease
VDKICSTCRLNKTLSAFDRQTKSKDGYQYVCKDCMNIHHQRSNVRHREKRRLASLAYRHARLQERHEKERLYREKTHTHQLARYAAYRSSRRHALREKDRQRRLNNLEKYRARERAYDALHRAERNAKAALRKALKKGASRGVPIKHLDIAERDNWLCHICHTKVRQQEWSLDHLIPLSKGGLHIPENVALAHKLCNNRRFVGNTIPAQLRLLP